MSLLDLTDEATQRDLERAARESRRQRKPRRRNYVESYYCRCDEVGPEQCPEHMDDYVPNR